MSETKVEWVKIKPAELEKIVVDLHKDGNTPAKIGLILRDKHAIPRARALGKRITQILAEAKQTIESEQAQVQKKIHLLQKHATQHAHDYTAKKSLSKKLWVLHRLSK